MNNHFSNSKTTGLTTPKDYFDGMEDRVLNQIALENKTLKENPFSIPDGYFEKVEAQVLEKIVKKQPKVVSILQNRMLKYAASIAAMALLIFTVYQIQNNTAVQPTIVSAENESDFFDIYELEEMLTTETLDNFTIENNLSDDAIYEYLSYHSDITALVYENYEH